MNPHPRNQLKRVIGPGLWEDMEGGIHFHLAGILKYLGVEDTPENRVKAKEMVLEILRTEIPGATLVLRDKMD